MHAPPVRYREAYHACQGQGKRAPASIPFRLRGLDMAWCSGGIPHRARGDAVRARQTAGRYHGETVHGRRRESLAGTVWRLQQGGPPSLPASSLSHLSLWMKVIPLNFKMQALIQRCDAELEEMNLIEEYRADEHYQPELRIEPGKAPGK
jgi:hypothetical protein